MKTITRNSSIMGKKNELLFMFLSLLLALGLTFSACKGPAGAEGAQGPQGEQGPAGPQGEQGNANAMMYTFGGQDFSTDANISLAIEGLTEKEMTENAWLVYLVHMSGIVYHMPGYGVDGQSSYRVFHDYLSNGNVRFRIRLVSGPGEEYTQIYIIRIAAQSGNSITMGSTKGGPAISLPARLDISDYKAVTAYYGLVYR